MKRKLGTWQSKHHHLHVSSFAKYLHIHGGQTVDLERDDLVISPGFPGIKHDIHLHGLVWYQDSGLTVYLQVGTVLVLTLDTEKYIMASRLAKQRNKQHAPPEVHIPLLL